MAQVGERSRLSLGLEPSNDMRYLEEFKNLNHSNHRKTSDETSEYNCIAWAAGRNDEVWWPIFYPTAPYNWPLGLQDDEDLDTFIKGFEFLGYEICETPDFENGFIKVAIYTDLILGLPTHMARQLDDHSGWTSKLGKLEDISHSSLAALEGGKGRGYGNATTFMKRRIG